MTEASDPLWYYEIQFGGGWQPRTTAYPAKDRETTNGRHAVRAAQRVAEYHKDLSLDALRLIYGPKPPPAPPPEPPVITIRPPPLPLPNLPMPSFPPIKYVEWLEYHLQTLSDVDDQIAVADLIVGIHWLTAYATRPLGT